MKAACLCLIALPLLAATGFAQGKADDEGSVQVTITGTLRTGVLAVGGETTGTTVTAKKIRFELEFGKNQALREAAEKLDGKKVVVQGSLERRTGVEVRQRLIVTVTRLQEAGKAESKAERQ
jgi:hypothetical protein